MRHALPVILFSAILAAPAIAVGQVVTTTNLPAQPDKLADLAFTRLVQEMQRSISYQVDLEDEKTKNDILQKQFDATKKELGDANEKVKEQQNQIADLTKQLAAKTQSCPAPAKP